MINRKISSKQCKLSSLSSFNHICSSGTVCGYRDVCTSDSCRNGGTCVPENGGFTCK